MKKIILAAFAGLFLAFSGLHLHAQDSLFSGRPGLTEAETPPPAIATCETLEAALKGFRAPQRRVDLWVSGALTIVHTDGALWYLVICSQPGVQVMCVTYSDNGMKKGERVTIRGSFEQLDPRHVRLDPCLATRL
ncbi:MAG: hypothetical protein ACRDBH_00170 [Bosea sp. (in: a-proteobacteria)]